VSAVATSASVTAIVVQHSKAGAEGGCRQVALLLCGLCGARACVRHPRRRRNGDIEATIPGAVPYKGMCLAIAAAIVPGFRTTSDERWRSVVRGARRLCRSGARERRPLQFARERSNAILS
jgi:hypothetical protein